MSQYIATLMHCLFVCFATYIVFFKANTCLQGGKLNCMILVQPRIAGKRPHMTEKKVG